LPDALEENKRTEPISCAFVAKPLGAGCDPTNPCAECTGVPAKKFRGAVMRPFLNGRTDAGVNMLIVSGYTGQTTENSYSADGTRNCRNSHVIVCQRHFTCRFGKASTLQYL